MITLYGSPRTSAGRCFWALEEAGLSYEVKSIDLKNKEQKSEWFLKINPNGKVPVLQDGTLTLFESMAINSYIAEKYKPELLGKSIEDRALIQQWSFWAVCELQPPLIEIFIQKVFVPEDRRDLKLIEENQKMLPAILNVLEVSLQKKNYLLGSTFTLADLNVATVASLVTGIGVDLSPYQSIQSWLKTLGERPAFIKYQNLRK